MENWDWKKIAEYAYRILCVLLLAAVAWLFVVCILFMLICSLGTIYDYTRMLFRVDDMIAALACFAGICADILFAKYIISVLKKEIVKVKDFLVTISFVCLLYIFTDLVITTVLPPANSNNTAILAILAILFLGFLKLSTCNNS